MQQSSDNSPNFSFTYLTHLYFFSVYLCASPTAAHSRMASRGRAEEATVSLEYIIQLDILHDVWLSREQEANMNEESDMLVRKDPRSAFHDIHSNPFLPSPRRYSCSTPTNRWTHCSSTTRSASATFGYCCSSRPNACRFIPNR